MTFAPDIPEGGVTQPAHVRPAFHPSQRHPRDAGTLILLDRTPAGARVLLGKRHPGLAFMPGRFVFPGGRVEVHDGRVAAAAPLADHVERRLRCQVARPTPARTRAYALAAIRELAEETGLLLGDRTASAGLPRHSEWRPFAERGIAPTLNEIWFIARAITPPGLPRRFDTRFFAASSDRVVDRIDGIVRPDAELVELRWVGLNETANIDLHPITRVILRELAARIEAGISRDLPVPFFRSRAGTLVRDEI